MESCFESGGGLVRALNLGVGWGWAGLGWAGLGWAGGEGRRGGEGRLGAWGGWGRSWASAGGFETEIGLGENGKVASKPKEK